MAKVLTDRAIKALKPTTSRQEVADGAMPGLYMVVQPTGAMSWAYRYRSPVDGKPRKLTIGRYPAFGLADARKSAGAAARSVAEQRDPGAEKLAARKSAQDRSDLVNELLNTFVSRHVDKKKDSTANEMRRLIDREVRPAWGNKKIHALHKRDVVELLDGIVERGAETTANRVFALLRRFGNWCVERGVLETSFAATAKAPSEEVSRDRVLTDDEIRWLWAATSSGVLSAATRLLLITGQRRGEVAGMTRAEIAAGDLWHIPPERTKNGLPHDVPLSGLALETIRAVPALAKSKLVFTTSGDTPVSGWSKAKRAIDAAMLKAARAEAVERGNDPEAVSIPEWRIHDLRRTAASGMARLGQPVHVVEAMLNHKSGTVSGVAAVYNRYSYADEKRRAADAWSSYLETLVSGKPSNVVPIKAAG
ncbi:tyrosine-type recombinase/integrase [Devosia sp. RR2S18]|uniref:tyrosine-type recombinase/integrase n=1 Tax=Devosia rhizosphaerae TaxID=3049774 RepID=UPI00254049E4|nr:site-specific integrase [Devosia sp. RR2S18]WIJ26620.1 integrase arm-type DNA-binding domain-containing protein [Devosia sp. RR2S18]